jgi:preprotein translocase subunit SecF
LVSKLKFPDLPLRQAIGLPLVVLVVALLVTGFTFVTVGSPLHLGVDFKGGTMVTLKTDHSDDQLSSEFSTYPVSLVSDASNGLKTIRFDQMSSSQQDALASYVNTVYPGSSIEHTGSTFSAANQAQAVWAIVIAFIGMAIAIFVIFRSPVPCVAVIMSAFSDIMCAVALMNLFHIELTFGTFAALLMLIGYSVDTDILLTTKVLGERKYIDKKITSVRLTGLTMTGCAIAAFLVLYIVSTFDFVLGFSPIPVLGAISTVMIFGLLADIMNTWFFNAGLLKWYMESPEAKAKYG